MKSQVLLALALTGALATSVTAQSVRSRIRGAPRGTTVSKTQAIDLTLTVTAVAVRPVQIWVRTAGTIDGSRKVISTYLSPSAAATGVSPAPLGGSRQTSGSSSPTWSVPA